MNTTDFQAHVAAWEAQRVKIDCEVQLTNLAAASCTLVNLLSLADTYRALAWIEESQGRGPYRVLEIRGARQGPNLSTLLQVLAELAAGRSCCVSSASVADSRRDLAKAADLQVIAVDDAGCLSAARSRRLCQVAQGQLEAPRRWHRAGQVAARPVIVAGQVYVAPATRARAVSTITGVWS